MLAFTLANLCATGAWIAAYPTFAELFPTGMRATGIGASVAFGRIGAAIAPRSWWRCRREVAVRR